MTGFDPLVSNNVFATRMKPVLTCAVALTAMLSFAQAAHSLAVTIEFTGELTRYLQGQGSQWVELEGFAGTAVAGSFTVDLDGIAPRLATSVHRLWDNSSLEVSSQLTWVGGVFEPTGVLSRDYVNVYNDFLSQSGYYDEWGISDAATPNCSWFCAISFLDVVLWSTSDQPGTLTTTLDPLQMPDVSQANPAFGQFGSFGWENGYVGNRGEFLVTGLSITSTPVPQPNSLALMLMGLAGVILLRIKWLPPALQQT